MAASSLIETPYPDRGAPIAGGRSQPAASPGCESALNFDPTPIPRQAVAALAELWILGEIDRRSIVTPPFSDKELVSQRLASISAGVTVRR
jgi:hypothetical protein